jgi:hypothetical protein
VEVHHAVEAGEGGGSAVIAVGVEFLLREDITAGLAGRERRSAAVEIRGNGAKWAAQ